jgi:hypothetical protein
MVTALDKTILYRLYKPIPRRKPNLGEAKDEAEMVDRLSAASARTIPDVRSTECTKKLDGEGIRIERPACVVSTGGQRNVIEGTRGRH